MTDDSSRTTHTPVTVTLVNDYEVVVQGLRAMLEPYSQRVQVVALEVGSEPSRVADVGLFDTFGGRRHVLARAEKMVADGFVDHVVFYTWDAAAPFLDEAERIGVSGVILKSATGDELVDAIERVTSGERVGLDHVTRSRRRASDDELSAREREVLALVALGLTNRAIADELYLSVDTIKTYVRRVYTKLGVVNRAQAASRAAQFDLQPPPGRING
jgi:two-component system, NarL family, response regulator LiaR